MVERLQDTGAAGYLILAAGLLAVGAGLVAGGLAAATRAFRPALVAAGLAAGFAFVAFIGGNVGRQSALREVYRAVASVSENDRDALLAQGRQEAQAHVTLALPGAVGFLLSAAAVALAFARTRDRP